MGKHIRLLGVSGSLRRASYNTAALTAAAELVPADVTVEIFSLVSIPAYNWDVEARAIPQAVCRLNAAIRACDGLIIATPEYNRSLSGVLKNALDWASRPYGHSPLNNKLAALLGATTGASGTRMAQLHLEQVCNGVGLRLIDIGPVLIKHAHRKFDEQGALVHERTRQCIRSLVHGLVSEIIATQSHQLSLEEL